MLWVGQLMIPPAIIFCLFYIFCIRVEVGNGDMKRMKRRLAGIETQAQLTTMIIDFFLLRLEHNRLYESLLSDLVHAN